MKRKWLALFLAALLAVALPLSASAVYISGNLTWDIIGGVLTVGGSGDMRFTGTYSVPWIRNCDYLKSAVIEDGITSIGDYAFEKCANMTSVTVPDGITKVGSCAFYGCTALPGITLPNSVTSIGASAFSHCAKLASFTIPNGVTSIGKYGFDNCVKLTSITLPNSVTSIGDYAFQYCTDLTSVIIGDSVTSIGKQAFDQCPKLTIYGPKNAYAETYAKANNIPYVALAAPVRYEYELTGAPTLGGDKDGTYSISTYYLDDAGEKVYIEKNRNTDVAISFESWYLRTMYQYRTIDGQLDIRFVSMLNDLIDDYAEAGFVFRIDELDWEETVTTNEVYTSFKASEIDQYIADYSRENDYFFLQNTLFSEDVVKEGYTVTVYAFVTTKDGTTYHGAPITIDLANLQ